jgi:choline dehydrogenase-like flavoprotein
LESLQAALPTPTLHPASERLPDTLVPDDDGIVRADIVIIGSGIGGSTLAYGLRDAGADVVVVERGDFLPREWENWSPEAVFEQGRYKNAEDWYDSAGRPFQPGNFYYVGGNSKVYGAMLCRFREQDFDVVRHRDGTSPAWPISYADLEPFYAQAEHLYLVHGDADTDPTDPWRSSSYPLPALTHEPYIGELALRLHNQGLRPFAMPAGIDLRDGGACVRCRTCDGYPCMVDAKSDADVRALRPLARSGRVRLLTNTTVKRLLTSESGDQVIEAIGTRNGQQVRILGRRFALAAGAVNSAALLLRSANAAHPNGLANTSDLVGRNYMVHNSTFVLASDPRRRNPTRFQKTLAINDWYLASSEISYPLGNVQMLGKLQAAMVKAARPHVPRGVLKFVTDHSVDLILTSEDLPDRNNRIVVNEAGGIVVHWSPNNVRSHDELVRRTKRALRRAGYPLVLTERMGIATNSHQCGTLVMGHDPMQSVLNRSCRTHDIDNLWAVDASFFPSSAAMNPALTIAANALRVAHTGGLTD